MKVGVAGAGVKVGMGVPQTTVGGGVGAPPPGVAVAWQPSWAPPVCATCCIFMEPPVDAVQP